MCAKVIPLLIFELRVPRKENPMENLQALIKKEKGLKDLNFSELVKDRTMNSYTEFVAIAEKHCKAGQIERVDFLFSRNEKLLRELVSKTWQMDSAKVKFASSKLSRIEKS